MWQYLEIGLPLLFLAAIWPPYNILIAKSLIEKDYLVTLGIIFSSFLGLSLSVFLLVGGAKLTHLPLSLMGGVIVILLGIKMIFSKEKKEKVNIAARFQTVFTTFLLSAVPGVYALTAASGFLKGDLNQVLTVYLAGPTLGITSGGLLIAYGVRYSKLPLNKIGGILLIFIGLKMIF